MNKKNIGQNLGTLRRQCGMTQSQIAEQIGVSIDHISHVEIGKGSISLALLLKICKLMNVTPNDILAGEYEKKSDDEDNVFQEESNYCSKISLEELNPGDRILMKYMYQFMVNRRRESEMGEE